MFLSINRFKLTMGDVSSIDIIKDSFKQLFNHPVYFVMALINFLAFLPLYFLLLTELPTGVSESEMAASLVTFIQANIGYLIAFFVLILLLNTLSLIFYTLGAIKVKQGRKFTFKSLFRESLDKFPKVLLGWTLYNIFTIVISMTLLVVVILLLTGLIIISPVSGAIAFILIYIAALFPLLMLFIYYLPAVVLEDEDVFKTFSLSFQLGKENLGATFSYLLLMFLINMAFSYIPVVQIFSSTIIMQPMFTIGLALMYDSLKHK